jgi:hypothetical protein
MERSHRDIDVCRNRTRWKPRPDRDDMFVENRTRWKPRPDRDDMFVIRGVNLVFQTFRPHGGSNGI